jgi:hypothetical protein
LALVLDTRRDDQNAPADARRAQADEEEREKLAYRVHDQILAVVHGGGKRRSGLIATKQGLADCLLAAAELLGNAPLAVATVSQQNHEACALR